MTGYLVRFRVRRHGVLWSAWVESCWFAEQRVYDFITPRHFVRFRRETAVRAAARHFLGKYEAAKRELQLDMRIDG